MRNTLKNQVEHCLAKYEEARNSDIKLFNSVIYEFHNSKLTEVAGEYFIKITDLYGLPKASDVERYRRKFNEELRYLPTSLEVAKARKINEQEWRHALGYFC